MKLFIKETGEEKTISLREWKDDQWQPDCFQDLETEYRDEEEVSQEEFDHIVDYWENETELHNMGRYSDVFGDPDDEYYNDNSFELFVR